MPSERLSPNPRCEALREEIERVANWFSNLESFPSIDEPDYEEVQDQRSAELNAAYGMYKQKPTDCGMIRSSYDRFDCQRCGFDCIIP